MRMNSKSKERKGVYCEMGYHPFGYHERVADYAERITEQENSKHYRLKVEHN